MSFNNVGVHFITTIAQRALAGLCAVYLNPNCLSLIGVFSLIHISLHLFPMYTPFIFSDSRSVETMKHVHLADAELLHALTDAVHEQARMMGAKDAEKINVRFGTTNSIWGSAYSFGGPLLLMSKSDVKIWFADGSINDIGRRIIGHELTRILENHSLWTMPFRIMGIALSCGLCLSIRRIIPSIPIVSNVISAAFLVFRNLVTGFILGPVDRYFESRADSGSIHLMKDKEKALKIAQAGHSFFVKKAADNLSIRRDAIAKGGFKAIWYYLKINDQGENRLDFTHQGYTIRASLFNSLIDISAKP